MVDCNKRKVDSILNIEDFLLWTDELPGRNLQEIISSFDFDFRNSDRDGKYDEKLPSKVQIFHS